MRHYKPYLAYKSSDVEWLGSVPNEWNVKRLRFVANPKNSNVDKKMYEGQVEVRLCNYTDVYYNEAITSTIDFMHSTANESEIEAFSLLAGDVIITKDSETADDIGIPAFVPQTIPGVVCGYHLTILRSHGIGGEFLFRLLQSKATKAYFFVEVSGVTRFGLGQDAIKNIVVPIPSREEQRILCSWMNQETIRIDGLISKKTRFIELLREKRQALITHAVTKGIDPKVMMKNSGVEWLGDMPEHWSLTPLKYISPSLTVGVVVNPSEYVTDVGLPFIYGGDISEGRINFESSRRITKEHSNHNSKSKLAKGDLLTVRVGAPGVTAVVSEECEGGNCASVMHIRHGNFDSDWLCYVMNSRAVRYQVEVVQYGAAQEQFNISHAVDFLIPRPDSKEQRTIVNYINRETHRIDELIRKTELSIELLKERRSALITAAVTGQIDLREAA